MSRFVLSLLPLRSLCLKTESNTILQVSHADVSNHFSSFVPRCTAADQYGWPVFETPEDLNEAAEWSSYFKVVYGEVPTEVGDFPICTYDFWFIHKDKFDEAGLAIPTSAEYRHGMGDKNHEDNLPGDLWRRSYRHMTGYFLHHDLDERQVSSSVVAGDNTWIEVRHLLGGDSGEVENMWFSYAPGSGIWFNTGKTAHYTNIKAAADDLCGSDTASHVEETEFSLCARDKGVDTLIFAKTTHPRDEYLEVMSVSGRISGQFNCGQKGGGRLPEDVIRAGWRASTPCDCADSSKASFFTHPDDATALPEEPKEKWLNCQFEG